MVYAFFWANYFNNKFIWCFFILESSFFSLELNGSSFFLFVANIIYDLGLISVVFLLLLLLLSQDVHLFKPYSKMALVAVAAFIYIFWFFLFLFPIHLMQWNIRIIWLYDSLFSSLHLYLSHLDLYLFALFVCWHYY